MTILGFAAFLTVSPAAETAKEHQLKAAFLYNFTRFIEWPATIAADEPFVIGLWSDARFADELRTVIGDRKINGRSVSVREFTSVADLQTAHVAFIGAQNSQELDDVLATLHARKVLTIGESERFAAAGGIITFAREADKLRFAINLKSSEEAGLKISAQLLKLATEVRR